LSSCIAELNRLGAGDFSELHKDDAKMSNGEDAGEYSINNVHLSAFSRCSYLERLVKVLYCTCEIQKVIY